MSHYFADRGNKVDGIDQSLLYVWISNLVSKINYLDAEFSLQTFDSQYIKDMPAKYHGAFLLSVLHHVVNRYGLEQTKVMVADLMTKVPILFVELALPEEDVTYKWKDKLPADPLEIFEKAPAHDIKLLGYFPTHLSNVKRPLYMITRKELSVNGKVYPYEKMQFFPYNSGDNANSMVLSSRKKYFWAHDYIIKSIEKDYYAKQELKSYKRYSDKIKHNNLLMPTLIDYEESKDRIILVLNKLPGNLLDENLDGLSNYDNQDIS